ncbi:MAG: DUF2490 domain-containing protein [Myxococcota bacterium]
MVSVLAPTLARAQDDLRHWSRYFGRVTRPGPLSFGIYAELRLQDNASTINDFFVGPKIGYKLSDYIVFGGALKYILLRTSTLEQWQRLELEVNPQLRPFGKEWQVQLRNRVEFVRISNDKEPDEWRTRARHRLTLSRDLEGAGPLDLVYASNELIWGQTFFESRNAVIITENRFVPFAARLRLSEIAKISVFYMLRSSNEADPWLREHTLGTFLSITPRG